MTMRQFSTDFMLDSAKRTAMAGAWCVVLPAAVTLHRIIKAGGQPPEVELID